MTSLVIVCLSWLSGNPPGCLAADPYGPTADFDTRIVQEPQKADPIEPTTDVLRRLEIIERFLLTQVKDLSREVSSLRQEIAVLNDKLRKVKEEQARKREAQAVRPDVMPPVAKPPDPKPDTLWTPPKPGPDELRSGL